jgi:tetratricopeptide (TPR) repeat protein
VAPGPVLADPSQARAHFDRGRSYFEVEDYRKAIVEFKAAQVEKPDPAFLYNIAECHRRLGEPSEALLFYRRFLETAPAGDKTRPVVEQRVAELKTVAEEPKTGSGEGAAAGGDLALNAPTPKSEPGAVLIKKPESRPSAAPPPFYTRAWFLITVGVVAAASAAAIWALARTPEPPATTLGNQSVF